MHFYMRTPLLVFSVAFLVLLPMLISCRPTEAALHERGRELVGLSAAEVREKLGEPAGVTTRTYGPMMGPGEQLGTVLQNGDRYQEWGYKYGDKLLLIWFRLNPQGEPITVLDAGIHVEGRVY